VTINLKPTRAPRTKVLLTDTNRWALAARLAIGLSEAGCEVSAICPTPGHALLKTRAVQRTFNYGGFHPLQSLIAAIDAVDPDLIVPSCDRGVEHLHELYALSQTQGPQGKKLAALIERSLGSPASHSIVGSRFALLALAREEGICVPRTARIDTAQQLESWSAHEPFPWVLKADGTWGGGGVKIVHSRDQIRQSFTQLDRMFRLRRALKRLFVNRDSFGLRPWWQRSRRPVSVQSYIHGRPANCAVVCWQGRVLAGIAVEVVASDGLTGPASVVRVVDNPEMMRAASRLAARLSLSGFFGLDFMIEEGTGAAYLIEMNPRITPLCHLRLGPGRDMPAALQSELGGQIGVQPSSASDKEMIAYFPQAWNGDRELLAACFHDIPHSEPELVQELLQPFPDRTFLFRLINHLSQGSRTTLQTQTSPNHAPHPPKDFPSSDFAQETLRTSLKTISPPNPKARSARL
jgi:ATP-grasp domain